MPILTFVPPKYDIDAAYTQLKGASGFALARKTDGLMSVSVNTDSTRATYTSGDATAVLGVMELGPPTFISSMVVTALINYDYIWNTSCFNAGAGVDGKLTLFVGGVSAGRLAMTTEQLFRDRSTAWGSSDSKTGSTSLTLTVPVDPKDTYYASVYTECSAFGSGWRHLGGSSAAALLNATLAQMQVIIP
jgi:hypothetical protein